MPLHWSSVHGLLSEVHAVPFAFFASAGQFAELPGQFSARSHSPAAVRQTVLDDDKLSAGQPLVSPSQVSAGSHAPADARHTVPAGLFPSFGHCAAVPSQNSAGSQTPADARHWFPKRNVSGGHWALVPLQFSW